LNFSLNEDVLSYLKDIFSLNASENDKDNSFYQLERDYDGDRIIIQGNRILGGDDNTINRLVDIMKDAVQFTMGSSYNIRNVNFSSETVSNFCLSILRAMARTQSGGISYFLLRRHLGQLDLDRGVPSQLLIAPVSEVCLPIEIKFSLEERSLDTSEMTKVQAIEAMYATRRLSLRSGRSSSEYTYKDAHKDEEEGDDDSDYDDELEFYSISSKGGNDIEANGLARGSFNSTSSEINHSPTNLRTTTTTSSSSVQNSIQSTQESHTSSAAASTNENNNNNNDSNIASLGEATNLYHITQKHPTSLHWTILCEAQASGIYRLVDSDTLLSVALIKITYRKTFRGIPTSFLTRSTMSRAPSLSSLQDSSPNESSAFWRDAAQFFWSIEPCPDDPACSSISFESLDLNKLLNK